MEFGLSEEQVLLQDSVNRFLSDQVPLDEVRKIASGEKSDTGIWQGLTEQGIPGLLIPEAQGGVGLGYLDTAIVAECLGHHVTPSPFLSTAVIAPVALLAAGGQEDLLAGIAAGNSRVGIAFGEALGARADAGVSVSDGKINGKSIFVMDGNADHYLIADSNQHLYLVSANADGLERGNLTTIDATRSTCQLIYNDVTAAPISNDANVFIQALDIGRVMQAADTLGAAQCMLDQSVTYAMQRKQFNRVIASFQAVKHMCADMAANIEPCRSFVWYAGFALDDIPDDRRLVSCQVKAHLQDVGKFVSKVATEVHGGMGFTDLVGLHYWFKRIGANRQLLGSPEMLREEAARIQDLAA
ncbi:MAG: acyl-CoA/acyl-ACP dehydrogenase [Pseudomonadales bacterium]|nr:acyl-CoA/acyl-ACP dehydrogenase [Pseudomonadales bacterium]